jgi:hypothetical protein
VTHPVAGNVSSEPEEDEADVILAHLIAERTDPQRPKLAVHQIALLRMVALLLASGDTSRARDVNDLLERAPSIVSPGRTPEPTLQQVCQPDAELDITRLSNEQLVMLETLEATMSGRALPIKSMRMENALALTWLLDAGGEPDIARVRELVSAVLAPALSVETVFPSHHDELNTERSRRLAAEEEVKRLQHVLERAAQSLPENVVRLRREQQA